MCGKLSIMKEKGDRDGADGVMIELIGRSKKQYKANLHCHSTLSDGKITPEELKRMYRERGYSILAITDHEVPYDHSAMSEEDFLMLTGYEAYIRGNRRGLYDVYARETHLNLFARDPHNETMVCYNREYAKYVLKLRPLSKLKRVGSSRIRKYEREYVQEFIDTAREAGYLVGYNHPYWSMESEADILSYEGCFSLEIANGNALTLSRLEYNAPLYDRMLTMGKRIYCHAADDNHNKFPEGDPDFDSFCAYTYILADSLDYPSVIDALERGEFYASRGPRIEYMAMEGSTLTVECSPAEHIYVYTGSKVPRRAHARDGVPLTRASFEIGERAKYIRVTVFAADGSTADSRGYFPDEFREEK